MGATARFSELVSKSGTPQVHTLWRPPENDAEFQRAIKAGRVLTLHQENVGSKKDYGVVGFSKAGPAQYLVFPRSLEPFQGRRVVGINYDVVEPQLPAEKRARARARPHADHKAAAHGPAASTNLSKAEPSAATEARRAEKSVKRVMPAGPHAATRHDASPISAKDGEWDKAAVVKQLRSALRDLEAGKAVTVFRRLEKLVAELAGES